MSLFGSVTSCEVYAIGRHWELNSSEVLLVCFSFHKDLSGVILTIEASENPQGPPVPY